jgi:hypothetical protein
LDVIARQNAAAGSFVGGYEKAMTSQVVQSLRYLSVRTAFESSTEVFAVDLAVPEIGAEAGVEDLWGGGEGERPDLRLVPELPNADGVLRASAAGIVEEGDFRERGLPLSLHPGLN